MSEIKVSVVIPVYNVEKYLHECMDSVINQTLSEIEIICVDDGSTDNSLSILQEYAKNDDRIIVLQQENQGAGVARNAGLEIAKGEYLSFLDPDDFFEFNMLEETYEKAIETDVDIVVFGCNSYDDTKKEFRENVGGIPGGILISNLPNKDVFSCLDMPKHIFNTFGYTAWNKLYKRTFINTNNITFQPLFRCNDKYFCITSLAFADKITTIESILLHYRIGMKTNSQATLHKHPYNFYECELAIRDKINQLSIKNQIRQSFLNSALDSCLYHLNTQKSYTTFKIVFDCLSTKFEQDFDIHFDLSKHNYFDNYFYKNNYQKLLSIKQNTIDEYIELKNIKFNILLDLDIKVSVIMPVYNSSKYLSYALESVLNQTYSNIEIICIDDGSTDSSLEILQHFAKKDNRIVVLTQENKYAGVARNLGLSVAEGQYITFFDSDDIMVFNAIEKMLMEIIDTKADIVITAANVFSNNVNDGILAKWVLKEMYKPIGNWFSLKNHARYIFQISVGIPWGRMYNADFIKTHQLYFPSVPRSEDFYFVFWSYAVAQKIAILNYVTVNYRVIKGNGSLEDSKDKYPDMKAKVKRMLYDKLNEIEVYHKVEQSFINTVINGNYSDLISLKNANAYEQIFESFKEEVKFYNIDMEDMSYFYNKEAYIYMKKLYDCDNCFEFLFEKNQDLMKSKHLPTNIRNNNPDNNQNNKINGQLRWARNELEKVRSERLEYKKEVARASGIKSSITYKIGSFFTFIPRSIRNCFKKTSNSSNSNVVYKNISNKDYNYYKALSPEYYEPELKEWYQKRTGETLDLKNPKTFNEKIQWLKLYDSTPLKTRLADKYLVRDWIKEKIGEEYLITHLGVWDSFDEINFDQLPNQFALKTNHGAGWNYIVKDKSVLDMEDAKKKFNLWVNKNFAFNSGFELHYLNIKPKIIAEKYIENANDLYDYKLLCFNGKFKYLLVYSNRNFKLKKTFFDENFNCLNINYQGDETDKNMIKPLNFNKMISLAEKLSKGFALVRVDFYEIEGKIFFGEMTFTPSSGINRIEPKQIELELGDKIKLPKKSKFPKLEK